jgi:AraC-like DNA-binding protein
MATVLAIPDLLRSLGANPEEVLRELGYDLKLFDHAETRVTYAIRNHILSHCAARTGCPHFGLLVGQHNGLHSFGLVGPLVKYAPDVGTAMRSFIRYQHLHVQGAGVHLAADGNSAMLTWQIYQTGIEAIDHIGDAALATLYNIMHELCGADWRPTEVWFAHRRPADAGPFRRFFRVPLRFDAEQYALLFSAGFLKRRLPGIDDKLRALLQEQIELLEARRRDDFPAQVRTLLHTALMTGQSKADQVAALFGIHSRTLNRRLNAFGVGFQQLVEETRFEIAQQMLEYSTNEIGKISESLGYAAPGVFTRAFRRWSGTTPAEWRAARSGRT